MAYDSLKSLVRQYIKTNAENEITGQILQNVLITMIDELGSEYSIEGIATPSTNPGSPSGKAMYFASQAGTYTYFDGATLPLGIHLLVYNGTSWSHQTFFAVDATPTSGSSNFISSGAVFDAFKNDGGAYDVSVHFPTGGVNGGNTYDLADAIAKVPSNMRKGGMSIKFVQSSDNKYVQYFLTKDEWSANEGDWQKLNLEEKVSQLRQQLIEVTGEKYTFESSSYRRIPFNVVLPIGTKIDKTLYPHPLYVVDIDNNDILIGAEIGIFTTTAEIVAFKPTTNDSGTICVIGELDGYDEQISKINKQIIGGFGVDVSFVNKAYSKILFDIPLPVGTVINNNGYAGYMYLYDKDGNEYGWNPANHTYTTTAEIVSFRPTTNDSGRLSSDSTIKDIENTQNALVDEILSISGVDISFVNKAYSKILFGFPVPIGTVLNNNGYAGMIYLYDKDGTSYNWNPANHTYTTTAEIVSFQPTTNDSGRITTESKIKVLTDLLTENITETKQIKTDIGLYHCNIWGGQVNFKTGQLYNLAYNKYHFSDPVPIDENTKYIYCPDSNVDRYMYFSDMPIIGENTNIYLGYREKINTSPAPNGAKYAVVVFANQYIPSVQPFDVFVDKIAYSVKFSKKMDGKKLVTIGDSLTQSCVWQPKLMRYSGMQWSFNECYAGVGYVNINTGEYTTENKSTDPDYRPAYPSALYGTPIRPTSANSIFMRSFDVKFYTPDIIFIYAGENDPINNWKSANNPGTTPDEIVANETPYKTNAIDASVSAIAAYKGMIENLMEDCPGAVIYIVSSMRVYGEIGKEVGGVVRFQNIDDVKEWEETARFPRVEYMRAIAKYYNLPLIDLWSKSGINDYNASQWYGETAADATQVHPENNGYLRMADVMLQCL